MWKFLRVLNSTSKPPRQQSVDPVKSAPSPFTTIARDYIALDATVWPLARRRTHPAETDPR